MDSSAHDSELIETEDVSFCSMVSFLLWKNYKSQLQRRKKSWCVKMLLPVVFTCILGALRTAFSVDHEPVAFGQTSEHFSIPGLPTDLSIDVQLNQPFAIDPVPPQSPVFITVPLCMMDWTGPAPFISIVPRAGSNAHIDAVMGIVRRRWRTTFNISAVPAATLANLSCVEYATALPFAAGWLLKEFDDERSVEAYCKMHDYGKGFGVSGRVDDPVQARRPIAFGITWEPPSEDGLRWSYRLRFNASGDSQASQQGGRGPPSPFDGTLFPVPSTKQDNVNIYNPALLDQWRAGPGNYYYSFFVHVQNFIDLAIAEYVATLNGSSAEHLAHMGAMTKGFYVHPTPAYTKDDFWVTITGLFVFFILISFVYPYSQIVKALVEEKAAKIKEGLKMMGATCGSSLSS